MMNCPGCHADLEQYGIGMTPNQECTACGWLEVKGMNPVVKLNKTERKIMALAAECMHGTISMAQRVGDPVVSRNMRAVQSLRAKGLMEQINSFTEWNYRRGHRTLYSVTHDTITEAGRKALETLS